MEVINNSNTINNNINYKKERRNEEDEMDNRKKCYFGSFK